MDLLNFDKWIGTSSGNVAGVTAVLCLAELIQSGGKILSLKVPHVCSLTAAYDKLIKYAFLL